MLHKLSCWNEVFLSDHSIHTFLMFLYQVLTESLLSHKSKKYIDCNSFDYLQNAPNYKIIL